MLVMPQISKCQPYGDIKIKVIPKFIIIQILHKTSTHLLVLEMIQFLSGEPTDQPSMTSPEPELYHENNGTNRGDGGVTLGAWASM